MQIHKIQMDLNETFLISQETMEELLKRDIKLKNIEKMSSMLRIQAEEFKQKSTLPWYKKWRSHLMMVGSGGVAIIIGTMLIII